VGTLKQEIDHDDDHRQGGSGGARPRHPQGFGDDSLGELRDILRRWIASFPPEKAGPALVELFAEIDILNDVIFESCGFKMCDPNDDEECPF
jgi:hypothetical protein